MIFGWTCVIVGGVGMVVSLFYAVKFQLQLRANNKERREFKIAVQRINKEANYAQPKRVN